MRIIGAVRVLSVVLLITLVAPAQEWPFGAKGFSVKKRDDYNLGLLGAKAMDAAEPEPDPNAPPRQGKQSFNVDKPAHDRGPDALRVTLLYPGGPAEKAGLKPGDIIVGVGTRKFSKGSLEPIAKALLKAESGKGVVTLLVKGRGKARKVNVAIPTAGKAAAKPTADPARGVIVNAALAFLARKQAEDGGFPQTLSGLNGAVVQTSMAGLAWLAGGGDEYKDNIKRAGEFVARSAGTLGKEMTAGRGGANWNQSNWGLAYGAMFLGELQARTPSDEVKQALFACAKALVENQEETGGWAHGPGGPNALGYVELNIVTGLALMGLGVARQAGFEIPEACLDRAETYLKNSGGGDGGVAYSHKPGQKGQGNIGRTAGAWIGYLALGRGKTGWGRKMGSYVKRHVTEVLNGHASLLQHVQLAGIASAAHGGGVRKEFFKALRRDLVLARSPDGSFQPRPWHESLSMKSNSDVSTGEIWSTATWACVLAAEVPKAGAGGLPALFGR
ncbi:MAG: DUF6288 domain-containing protein [Planctomycetota bacterium]